MQSQCQVVERQQQTLQWRFLFEGTECLSKHEEVKMQGSKSWESTLVVPAILVLVFWLEFCGDLKQTVQIVIYRELKMQEKTDNMFRNFRSDLWLKFRTDMFLQWCRWLHQTLSVEDIGCEIGRSLLAWHFQLDRIEQPCQRSVS